MFLTLVDECGGIHVEMELVKTPIQFSLLLAMTLRSYINDCMGRKSLSASLLPFPSSTEYPKHRIKAKNEYIFIIQIHEHIRYVMSLTNFWLTEVTVLPPVITNHCRWLLPIFFF